MIDTPTARHFRPEAKAKSRSIPSAELWDIRRQMAGVLLRYAGTDKTRRPGLSQREMAVMLGTSWDMVNSSLKSLQADGTIRIDRHLIIINRELLEKVGWSSGAYARKGGQNGYFREVRTI